MQKYIHKFDFFRYSLVGIITVIIDFLLLYIFYDYLMFSKNISITLSYALASTTNFFMHKYFTFKSSRKIFKEIIKFVTIVVLSYLLTIFLINYFIKLGINIYISKIITLIISYVLIYFISKFFIYRSTAHV